jgi:TIR domain
VQVHKKSGLTGKTKIFLSYSRVDEVTVAALAAALEEGNTFEVFLDKDDILPAEGWRDRLEALILAADTVVFCLSPDSIRSKVVLWEIEMAERFGKRIVPLVLRRADEKDVPERISRLNYLYFDEPTARPEALERLRTAIATDIHWIREHTRIGELAQRWAAVGRRKADLLRGDALAAAEDWLANQPPNAPLPTALHHEFVGAGRHSATVRQRWWVTGSLMVAVLATVLSLIAYWQRGIAIEQRTEANGRRLAAEAQLVLANPLAEPETAVRNLLVSHLLVPSETTLEALQTGVNRLPPRRIGALALPKSAGLRALSFSPHGHWLAAMTSTEVLAWDVGGRRLALRQPLLQDKDNRSLGFAEKGTRVLLLIRQSDKVNRKAAWLVADPATGEVTNHDGEDTLDINVLKDQLLVLLRVPSGGVVVKELPEDSSIIEIKTKKPVTFGRLYESRIDPSQTPIPMFFPGMTENISRHLTVIGEKNGRISVWDLENRESIADWTLPKDSEPLEVGGATGALAVRDARQGDRILNLFTGNEIWRPRQPDSKFHGFVGGGRFFMVEENGAPHLESLDEGVVVRVEESRRTDYDLGALNDLTRYTPIISAEVAERGGQIVTAWKDGRIAVWEAGFKPRWGGIDAVPGANFEAIARFDHGETLGATVTWTAPPALFVSPSGRYVASQSMGIKANALGAIESMHPLVRIWDTHHASEVARLRPAAPLVAAFSPADDIMASVTAIMPEPQTGTAEPEIEIVLWDLTSPGPGIGEHRQTTTLALTPPPGGMPTEGQAAVLIQNAKSFPARPVWIGADLQLRALDRTKGKIVVIDNLAPAFESAVDQMKEQATRADESKSKPGGKPSNSEEESFADLRKQMKELPPEFPFMPVMLSEDGRRALVFLGTRLRLYALDGRPRLLKDSEIGDKLTTSPSWMSITGTTPVLLCRHCRSFISRDGSNLLFVKMTNGSKQGESDKLLIEGLPKDAAMPALPVQFQVYDLESAKPRFEMMTKQIQLPMQAPRDIERPVALGPEGKRIVLDTTSFKANRNGPPQITGRFIVRDLQTGKDVLVLPPRPLTMNPMGSWEPDGGNAPVAAFDATGDRLVVVRDAPDCPMKTVITPSWMPIQVPVCEERRLSLSLWDIRKRERIDEVEVVVRGGANTMPMFGWQMMPIAGATLRLEPNDEVTLSSFEMAIKTETDPPRLEITEIRHEIAFGQENPLLRLACARLPREFSEFGKEAWTSLIPAEAYRPICPSDRKISERE